jgi:hypothetical protein
LEIHIDGFPDELIDLFESQVEEAVEEAAEVALYAAIPPLSGSAERLAARFRYCDHRMTSACI